MVHSEKSVSRTGLWSAKSWDASRRPNEHRSKKNASALQNFQPHLKRGVKQNLRRCTKFSRGNSWGTPEKSQRFKALKSHTPNNFQVIQYFTYFQYKKFHYFNISQTGNDQFINFSPLEMDCEINTRENPCGLTPKMSLRLLVDLPRPYLHLKVFEVETKKLYLKQQISFCSISQNPGLNIFIRLFFEQLKEVINFTFQCPMKKVNYFF